MTRPRLVLLLSMSFIFWIGCGWAFGFPEAKLTIKVVDQTGQPVDGARVGIGFEKNTGWGTEELPIIGFSNGDGLFMGSAHGNDSVGFTISKEGYYNSYGVYQFKEKKLGRWEPWNPVVTVVLRKIENSVSMYARDTKKSPISLPVSGKPVGFDLIEFDWVSPYGKGKYADFVFRLDRKFVSDTNFEGTLTLTFSNKHDGIQVIKEDRRYGSMLKLPRFAPNMGYHQKLVRKIKSIPGKPLELDFKDDNNYIFRIRSEEKDGKLVRAMYGKIHGDIIFDPRGSKTTGIVFKYFLNPDYTRNLEYGRNLFENLKSIEQVGLE